MILYNETINIDQTAEIQWLNWMKRKHVPSVLNTGLFLSARLSRLSSHIQPDSTNYTVQYLCENSDHLNEYKTIHLEKLKEEGTQLFGDKMQFFQTELDVIQDFFPNQS
ncbi:DUF4286 family protein [Flavobacteriaceae bacterium Ap0902]|nr:DUF4286 family protein [Flavobacteriaceae bacterium Ap0902]